MNFSEKLKSKRKEFGMSQEQLAEKIGVSRQAITKWETDGGLPDIENILSIASLFGVTVDALLSSNQLPHRSGFFYNSTTEYDIDSPKHFDINIGGAYEIAVTGHVGEKLHIQLASNTIASIEQLLKVKIDDGKSNIDVDIRRGDGLSEAQAKETLYVLINIPTRYITQAELSGQTRNLRITDMKAETITFEGQTHYVQIGDVQGLVELDCSSDMTVVCTNLSGGIDINQISATSTIHLPRATGYQLKKKRDSNRVRYTLDGVETEAPAYPDATNTLTLSGLNVELVINECSNITEVIQ